MAGHSLLELYVRQLQRKLGAAWDVDGPVAAHVQDGVHSGAVVGVNLKDPPVPIQHLPEQLDGEVEGLVGVRVLVEVDHVENPLPQLLAVPVDRRAQPQELGVRLELLEVLARSHTLDDGCLDLFLEVFVPDPLYGHLVDGLRVPLVAPVVGQVDPVVVEGACAQDVEVGPDRNRACLGVFPRHP